ncbi:MAG: hypothetical protein U9O98_00800 [Asgard group archaeon]|nr:hypothetical protein [Asgard group archaeon]
MDIYAENLADDYIPFYVFYFLQLLLPGNNVLAFLTPYHSEGELQVKINGLKEQYAKAIFEISSITEQYPYLLFLQQCNEITSENLLGEFLTFKNIADLCGYESQTKVVFFAVLNLLKEQPHHEVIINWLEKMIDYIIRDYGRQNYSYAIAGKIIYVLAQLDRQKGLYWALGLCQSHYRDLDYDAQIDQRTITKLYCIQTLKRFEEGTEELERLFCKELRTPAFAPLFNVIDALEERIGEGIIEHILNYHQGNVFVQSFRERDKSVEYTKHSANLKTMITGLLEKYHFREDDHQTITKPLHNWAKNYWLERCEYFDYPYLLWLVIHNLKPLLIKNKTKILAEMAKEQYTKDLNEEKREIWFQLRENLIKDELASLTKKLPFDQVR